MRPQSPPGQCDVYSSCHEVDPAGGRNHVAFAFGLVIALAADVVMVAFFRQLWFWRGSGPPAAGGDAL